MQASLAPGQAPVAVHRWFSRGEDWALHPYFTARMGELLRALDERLKARQPGPFEVEALGGLLVGELFDDPDCLDPRARDRRPCVIRVAFLPGRPASSDQVVAALRTSPLPLGPGVDQGLIVPVSGPVAPLRSPSPVAAAPPERSRSWAIPITVGLAAVVTVVVIGWQLTRAPGDPSRPRPDPVYKDATARPLTVPDDLLSLLRRYEKVDHPHVRFLVQRPEALVRSRGPDEKSYDRWRREQDHAFAAPLHPLPRRLRERVARWRELDATLTEVAERMRQLRKRWDRQAEDRPAPVEEIEAFFEAAVRPPALPPREELDHPANVFLWRLPGSPLAAGLTFDDEAALRAPLVRLAELLGAGPTSGASLDLLSRIERSMDYTAWREEQRRRGVVFADEAASPGAAVEEGLRRFGVP
jgi:hypothetical protein